MRYNDRVEPSSYILLALSEEAQHGYAIMQSVHRLSEGAVSLGPGTLYGCIKRLLSSGMIVEIETDDTNERRRTYELTGKGKEALAMELDRLKRVLDSSAARRFQAGVMQ